MYKRILLAVVAAAAVVVGALLWQPNHPQAAESGKLAVGRGIGEQAPDFSAKDASGQSHALSEYRGRPVLLNFWASWCPPCRAEMPMLHEVQQRYGDRLVVLEVNAANTERHPDAGKTYLQEKGLAFPYLLFDDGSAQDLYAVRLYPESFFIDSNGVVRAHVIGQLSAQSLAYDLALIAP